MSPSAEKAHLDELLDAALAGTFPASDPVSGLHATGGPARGESRHDDVIHGEVGERAVPDSRKDGSRDD